MKTRSILVPKKFYRVVPERIKQTRFIQQPLTGLMTGRKLVGLQRSDRTKVIRMTRPFDLNKDGRIVRGDDLMTGQTLGRVSKNVYPQRVYVRRYYKRGKPVSGYSFFKKRRRRR